VTRLQSLVVLAAALLVFLALLFGVREASRWRAVNQPELAPDRWAMQELQRIDALQLPAAGNASDFTRWFPTSPVVIWSYVFS